MLYYKNNTKYKRIGRYAYELLINSPEICISHDITFKVTLKGITHISYDTWTGKYVIAVNLKQLVKRIKGEDKWNRSTLMHLPKFKRFMPMLRFAVYHELGHYIAGDVNVALSSYHEDSDACEIAADMYALKEIERRNV